MECTSEKKGILVTSGVLFYAPSSRADGPWWVEDPLAADFFEGGKSRDPRDYAPGDRARADMPLGALVVDATRSVTISLPG